MTHTIATIGSQGFAVDIAAGLHRLVADEPFERGGDDTGPAPYDLLLSALGACTAITLRMYADRKGWAIDQLRVDLQMVASSQGKRVHRTLTIEGPDDAGKARLADIAERTPVTLTLKEGIAIDTTLATAGAHG